MSSNSRQFLQGSLTWRNEALEILQALFALEILQPSKEMWLVSPWISNIEILDNSTGGFSRLLLGTAGTKVRLRRVLEAVLQKGTQLFVVTRPGEATTVLADLEFEASQGLHVVRRQKLHSKGLLTDRFCLSGSMNFTFPGIYQWDELIQLHTSPEMISSLRLEFRRQYLDD